MKIVDFDRQFYGYAAAWVAAHPGMTEKQIDESYNRMMAEWMDRPADWLDGATPGSYFDGFSNPEELVGAVSEYVARDINVPEPLYTRIVGLGAVCEEALCAILKDETRGDGLRAVVLGMLRDMDCRKMNAVLVELVTHCEEAGELCNLAADILSGRAAEVRDVLLDAYDDAPDCAQLMILDICANIPFDARCRDYLIRRLKNRPEERAVCAALLEKLGDDQAIEPMLQVMGLFDLTYYDNMALRNAVEALGGDAGEERTFYGDPDYEALRNAGE